MKFLKHFESNEKYKEGDYVLLYFTDKEVINFLDGIVPSEINNKYIVKIIHIRNEVKHSYEVKFTNGYNFYISREEILRLATQDEIDLIESKISANKYNL